MTAVIIPDLLGGSNRRKTDLYVNLRCMNVKEDTLTLYAGGGLLASSELDDEFQETEKKMQTMKNLNSL